MPFLRLPDAEIYYELQGEGRPVVLIAGFTCDAAFWQPILSQLSQTYQVLLFDNRAVGRTKDSGTALSAELMADDTAALIEALGLKQPHVIGQSMGGTIAQVLAWKYPERIGKLVLLTTSAHWRKAILHGLHSLIEARKQQISFDIFFEMMLSWVFGEQFLSNRKAVAALKQLFLENPHPQSIEDMARQFHVLECFDSRPHLKQIRSECLIVYGNEDIIALAEEAQYLATHIAKSKIAACSCAHGIVAEAPGELSSLLREFLR